MKELSFAFLLLLFGCQNADRDLVPDTKISETKEFEDFDMALSEWKENQQHLDTPGLPDTSSLPTAEASPQPTLVPTPLPTSEPTSEPTLKQSPTSKATPPPSPAPPTSPPVTNAPDPRSATSRYPLKVSIQVNGKTEDISNRINSNSVYDLGTVPAGVSTRVTMTIDPKSIPEDQRLQNLLHFTPGSLFVYDEKLWSNFFDAYNNFGFLTRWMYVRPDKKLRIGFDTVPFEGGTLQAPFTIKLKMPGKKDKLYTINIKISAASEEAHKNEIASANCKTYSHKMGHDLLAYYNFDSLSVTESGRFVRDLSGNNFHATLSSDGIRLIKGVHQSKGIRFLKNQKLSVAANIAKNLKLARDFTMSFWVAPDWFKFNDVTNSPAWGTGTSHRFSILSRGKKDLKDFDLLYIDKEDRSELFLQGTNSKFKNMINFHESLSLGARGHYPSVGVNPIGNLQWVHMTIVARDSTINYYANGKLVNQVRKEKYFMLNNLMDHPSNKSKSITMGNNSEYDSYGVLDELAVWNRALSDEEIYNLKAFRYSNPKSECIASQPDATILDGEVARYGFGEGLKNSVTGKEMDDYSRVFYTLRDSSVNKGKEPFAWLEGPLLISPSEKVEFKDHFSMSVWVNLIADTHNWLYLKYNPKYQKPDWGVYVSAKRLHWVSNDHLSGNQEHLVSPLSPDLGRGGGWHHIAIAVDKSQVSLFVDGENILTSQTVIPINFDSHSHNMFGGLSPRQKYSEQNFNGMLDELILFNRTISAEKAKSLFLEHQQIRN